jgi:hypothetical protein
VKQVEYLIGCKGVVFALMGNVEKELLGITAVHQLREEDVRLLLARAGSGWEVVDRLVAQEARAKAEHNGHRFYLRRFTRDCEAAS